MSGGHFELVDPPKMYELVKQTTDTERLDYLERQCQQEEFLTDGMTLRAHIDKQMKGEK